MGWEMYQFWTGDRPKLWKALHTVIFHFPPLCLYYVRPGTPEVNFWGLFCQVDVFLLSGQQRQSCVRCRSLQLTWKHVSTWLRAPIIPFSPPLLPFLSLLSSDNGGGVVVIWAPLPTMGSGVEPLPQTKFRAFWLKQLDVLFLLFPIGDCLFVSSWSG